MNKAYNNWIDSEFILESERTLLNNLSNEDINKFFAEELDFGTGGIRAIMGLGISRLNHYTITKVTLGLANHFETGSCVIGYDNRNNSKEFALIAAKVLASKNIKTYLFNELRPTPYVSYAIRELKADFGIILTASHNPKEYNGYKVYGNTGAQILADDANAIKESFAGIDNYLQYFASLEDNYDLIVDVTDEIDAKYLKALEDVKLRKELKFDQKVVYSPLHGTGDTMLLKFAKANDINIITREEECVHDGNFPALITPNPESQDAFIGVIRQAEIDGAELAICTDPDADRLGVAIKHNGGWNHLNGNETAYLTLNYIINYYKENNIDLSNYYAVSTVVSSNNVNKVCKDNNIDVYRTLTGFKFIGGLIETIKDKTYLFGFEESYGSLFKTFARDKDALQASLLLIEAYHYLKLQNKTLIDYLHECYQRDGFYKDSQIVINLDETTLTVDEIIKQASLEFANFDIDPIASIEDYRTDEVIVNNEVVGKINLPKNDMLKINLVSESFVAVRPSGTEPKIKIYVSVNGTSFENCEDKISAIKSLFNDKILKN